MAHILVIDDDRTMRDMIGQMLRQAGHKVKSASGGKHGLKLLDKHPFDLVVTDIVMPEIGGVDLIQIIRTLNKTIPIMAVSGGARNDPESFLASARSSGATRTLGKPFRTAPFLATVNECLGERG